MISGTKHKIVTHDYKVIIQIWAEGLPDLSGECGEGSAVACKVFDPPRTLASCAASGGTLISEATCQWQDSLTSAPVSGLWAPWLEMTPGSGGIPVTSHRAALDAAIQER